MSKHREKIEKLFTHPISNNIDFKKLVKALEHYGARVEITKQNKAKIFLNDDEFVLPVPHDHVLSKDMVTELRHFLEKVGFTPDKID